MRHTWLYVRNSSQGWAGTAAHFDADFGNDDVDTERIDKHWGNNERLWSLIDDHNCNDNNRFNNDWFYNKRDDNHHIDERFDRHDRDRDDRDRRHVRRRCQPGCEHHHIGPCPALQRDGNHFERRCSRRNRSFVEGAEIFDGEFGAA